MILGITGTLGAGKGAVVDVLKSRGFVHYSGSSKLREILEGRKIPVNREAYSALANEIRTNDPEGLAKMLWQQYKDDAPQNAVIEAIHDVGEAKFLINEGAVLVGVDADLKVRYERISKRKSEKDQVSFEDFEKIAKYEEEGGGKHNIRAVLDMAKYTITNNGTLEELHAQVEDVLKKIEATA